VSDSPGQSIEVYFDYISPFAYFASLRLPEFAKRLGREPVWKPIDLMALSNFEGGLPYTDDKRAYIMEDCIRLAEYWNLPIAMPDPFPVESGLAVRAALVAQDLGIFDAYHSAVYRAAWAESRNIGDESVLADCIKEAGGDASAVLETARSEATSSRLTRQTAEAESRGVFGVPMMIVGEERFWGADRLEILEWRLSK
jgi:2-hydroxychromene-2-carboxylate isomerase